MPLLASLGTLLGTVIQLYLLVPQTSDHLGNLAHEPAAVATTATWSVRGEARLVASDALPKELALAGSTDARWYTLVVLWPQRFDRLRPDGWGALETIDIE